MDRLTASWSTEQLTEFLASVSPEAGRPALSLAAVEGAAAAIEAEIAALVIDGRLGGSHGLPARPVPEAGRRAETTAPGRNAQK